MERRSFSYFVQVAKPFTLREQKKVVVLVPRGLDLSIVWVSITRDRKGYKERQLHQKI